MKAQEILPMFILKCLYYGIQLYPFQIDKYLFAINKYSIPDEILNKFDENEFKKYMKGLDYAVREDAKDWSYGLELLKEIGFKEISRQENHRSFIKLEYGQ